MNAEQLKILLDAHAMWIASGGREGTKADLRGADLRGVNLSGVNLSGADLRGATLYEATLIGADLRGADLRGADLRRADLRGANLYEANLRGTNLREADLLQSQVPQINILPEGDIIGYKKCIGGIVKLLIPADAQRFSSTSRKCRAEYAKVLETEGGKALYSAHDSSFMYKVGEIVRPTKPFDTDWRNECTSGIHFFITRQEAELY